MAHETRIKRLARWSSEHRRRVLGLWAIALVLSMGVAYSVGSNFHNNFSLPGTDAQRATNLLSSHFPSQAGDSDQIVFHTRKGKLSNAVTRRQVDRVLTSVGKLAHVASVVSPYATHGQAISKDGTVGFATINFNQRVDELPTKAVKHVITTARSFQTSALQIELGGQAIEQASETSASYTFMVGIIAAMVVLFITFGSVVAMGLPLGTALLGLGTGYGLIMLLSRVLTTSTFVPDIALMIGLGVGVDYSLFIVTRYREAYRRNGGQVVAAVEEAMNTAGRAVIFAGTTVVIGLLGLFALGISLLYGMALATALAVLLVMAASQTLLPALMTFFGHRIVLVGRKSRRRMAPPPEESVFWTRWTDRILARPWTTLVAGTLVMLTLAAPVLYLHLGNADAGSDPTKQTTRRAYDLLAQGFGKGFSGPLLVAVKLPTAGNTAPAQRLDIAIRQTPGIAAAAPPQLSPDKQVATIFAYPTTSPQSTKTENLVKHLRKDVIKPLDTQTGATTYVGGSTAQQIDFSHVLGSRLPYFIGVVVLLSALLLMVVFRSLLVPLQAAVMNLLSIGAAMGIVVAVFQFGWGGSLFNTAGGPIAAFVPMMVFAIVFGLSMDYEVFLVSRIHEEWTRTGDSRAAVRDGLIRTGRVISAAAAVMVVVFASFVGGGNRIIELFGLGFGSAVLLDAVVVRLLLVPAVFTLLGDRMWSFPRRLDRRLPRLAIEAPPSTEARAPVVATSTR